MRDALNRAVTAETPVVTEIGTAFIAELLTTRASGNGIVHIQRSRNTPPATKVPAIVGH
jgi:hypothetical protein